MQLSYIFIRVNMITKILPLNPLRQPNISLSKKNNEKTQYPQHNLIGQNLKNSGLINFTSREYFQTLKDNYFKLPETASPDVFQKASAMNILNNNDVVVTAPTGTGKTAIAMYAISKNMADGVKTFYTTPLKALSNEKFRSFQKIYGEENVGLLTGDNKINPDAPIVVMTTEIYRNMVLSDRFNKGNPILNNLKTVIFDESHYLGDVDRGGIWEQSVILSDPKVQLISLSATIGNNKEIANWMAESKGYDKAEVLTSQETDMQNYVVKNNSPLHTVLVDVPSENRHVPLDFEIVLVDTDAKKEFRKNNHHKKGKFNKIPQQNSKNQMPSLEAYEDLVKDLAAQDKIPAIFFVFSKRNSKKILAHLSKNGDNLNSKAEQKQIDEIIKRYEQEGKYLGESMNYSALYRGYAIHNAGLLPAQKELIEELFNKKLIKVVIATETLSAGINMPARTTVITSDRTPVGELNANKFHQMAGRAGRRGIDTQGYCISMAVNDAQARHFEKLIESPPDDLKSAFRPEFSFVAGYYAACKNDELINELLEKSFYAYDNNPQIKSKKSKEMKGIFSTRRLLLRKKNFLTSAHKLTTKGELLTKLNGYEQIPIINAIYDKKFAGLDAVELAAAVAAMANLQMKFEKSFAKDEQPKGKYFHPNKCLASFVNDFESELKSFNSDMSKIDFEYKQTELNSEAIEHLYEWAKLNSQNDDSVDNWRQLYYEEAGKSIKNEGSVFREITITADLLKQMKLIAKTGMELADNDNDYRYYETLSYNIDQALYLICRTPVEI